MPAGAELLVNEQFAYPAGNLNSQGQWVTYGTPGSCPVNVAEGGFSFAGYQDQPSGNHAVVSMEMGKNTLQDIFAPASTEAVTGTVYYAAIIRVAQLPSSFGKPGAVMALTGVNDYDGSFGDSLTGSEGAGLFVSKGDSDDTVLIGICRQSSPNGVTASEVNWCPTTVNLGQETLVVVSYQQVEGENNDLMNLWVNPSPEDAAAPTVSGKGTESLVDIRGIALCQRSALTSKIPQVEFDQIRVATEWNDLFNSGGQAVVIPNVTVSENPIDFGQTYCNVTYSRSVVIRATDLTGDIALSLGESGQVSLSAETISKEQAMSEEGFELTISLTPVESRFYSDKVTLSTPGAADKVINLAWHAVPSLVADNFAQLCNESENDMTSVYVYNGNAVVTFVESYYDLSYDRVVNSIFCQDETGGVELRSATGCGYQEIDITGINEGDVLTDIVGYLIFGDSGLTMVPRTPADWRVVGHDVYPEPITLTLRQLALADNGYVYGNQLVRVLDVTFPDEYAAAGDYHGLWNSQKYEIYDGTLDEYEGMAWMWCNKGADYFKTSTEGYFTHRWNLTGIVNNYYPIHVFPRSFNDFEDMGLKESAVDILEAGSVAGECFDILGRHVTTSHRGLIITRTPSGSFSKSIRP